ncbi:MAG: hypothetical protein B7Y12_09905 [Rhizobiales bacterium 24-66-13]|jgi:hypothetical protein|uniref:hypothetical protein n=1 Tax=Roseixanthobacter finlandensis TaxID=3119922 RepID=UPI000BD70211|nr:MAG: hypothetical protein B7Y12_09905 [Rhizobiales bacterium 24-66-13]OZB04613.1 MAG: hypothetical protein B7X67_13780 [Rhizobiales bacterium 39-66-18]HQS08904.1 hypothetical protein [Xanthobacteraceae bacterium]HQS49065.1 hypothetical protein [Xanthobacteraceae bacterium]
MPFVSRLVLVVIFSVLLTIAAVAAGAFLAGERVNAEIEEARVSRLLGALRSTTEANLSIGLALDQISPLQSRIEREKASDSSVLAIDIFNAAGKSVYSTDRGSVGESVTEIWAEKLKDDGIWQTDTRGETVFGTRFENDLGLAGGIAVIVSDKSRQARGDALHFDLLKRSASLASGAVVLAVLSTLAFVYAVTRSFDRAARVLRGEAGVDASGQGLELLAAQAKETWTKSEQRIERGLAQLGALDDAH